MIIIIFHRTSRQVLACRQIHQLNRTLEARYSISLTIIHSFTDHFSVATSYSVRARMSFDCLIGTQVDHLLLLGFGERSACRGGFHSKAVSLLRTGVGFTAQRQRRPQKGKCRYGLGIFSTALPLNIL